MGDLPASVIRIDGLEIGLAADARQQPGGIANAFGRRTHQFHQREQQVAKRPRLGITHMPAQLHLSATAAGQDHRQIGQRMIIAVLDARAPEDQ